MKTLLLLALFALASTAFARPLPFPLFIAPPPAVPTLPATTVQAPTLTPTLRVYPAPVPVQAARPAVPVAVPVRR